MTLKLNGSSSGYTAIDAPATAGSNTLVLPANNGSAGQVLQTDGNGGLTWVTLTNYGLKDRTWYDTKTSLSTIGSTTYHNLTDFGVTTGTPASTNSKFLILVQLCYEVNPTDGNSGNDNDEGFGIRIVRTPSGGSATNLHEAATKYETYGKNNAGTQFALLAGKTFFHVDAPSSSAALTYKIQVAAWKAANPMRISPDSNISDLMVMELLA